ncbi:MAG: hypothetical protein ACTS5A_03515 [Candidatus Hodgkinia cicadicola]
MEVITNTSECRRFGLLRQVSKPKGDKSIWVAWAKVSWLSSVQNQPREV